MVSTEDTKCSQFFILNDRVHAEILLSNMFEVLSIDSETPTLFNFYICYDENDGLFCTDDNPHDPNVDNKTMILDSDSIN